MNYWQHFGIEELIKRVLREVRYQPNPQHHFRTPYFTAYQLAIGVNRLNPEIITTMGYEIGGKGTNRKVSFTQYIAKELSERIKNGQITDIEGAFISNIFVKNLTYAYSDVSIVSSLTGTDYDLSMFRLTPP